MTTDKISTEHSKADPFVALALMVPVAIWDGWVTKTLWRWFMVPLGMRSIGIAHAVGLTTLLLTVRYRHRKDKPGDPSGVERMLGCSFAAAIYLGVGYIAHHFMVTP